MYIGVYTKLTTVVDVRLLNGSDHKHLMVNGFWLKHLYNFIDLAYVPEMCNSVIIIIITTNESQCILL